MPREIDISGLVAGAVAKPLREAGGERSGPRPRMQLVDPGAPARLSPQQLNVIKQCGGDAEGLFDRANVAHEKQRRAGKPGIGNIANYMVKIAQEDFSRANGVEVGVASNITTGHKFQRDAARGSLVVEWCKTLGVPDESPAARLRKRAAERFGGPSNGPALLAALGRGRPVSNQS